jgi:transcriptional regulator with XRE-family HTH domain
MSARPQKPSTKARRLRHLLLMSLGQGEIGVRVKQARDACGFTQQELAERSGLKNGANISRIERGKTQLTSKRMRRIAAATRKPVEFFVQDLSANGERQREAPDSTLREDLASLARAVEAIAASQRETAHEVRELRKELSASQHSVSEQRER